MFGTRRRRRRRRCGCELPGACKHYDAAGHGHVQTLSTAAAFGMGMWIGWIVVGSSCVMPDDPSFCPKNERLVTTGRPRVRPIHVGPVSRTAKRRSTLIDLVSGTAARQITSSSFGVVIRSNHRAESTQILDPLSSIRATSS
jgi:hypothetical protein